MRRPWLLAHFLFAALLTFSLPGFAVYPEKPIRLIVPSAPGGASDVLMRALVHQLSIQMGVPFVVDNKPGASFVIGTMDLVKSAPDGYTLAYGNLVSLATNRSLLPSVPYDVDKDLTLISNAVRVANLMIVNKDVPVKSIPELIDYARKNPGKLAFASEGNGTTSHLGMELFKAMTQTQMLHVPYKGATAAMTDLIGGGVQVMLLNAPVAAPQVQTGRVRSLGISELKRSSLYPDTPTIAESGVPGFEVVAWGGLIGPANLPKEIVNRLNQEIRTALAKPELKARFHSLGSDAEASSPEEFRELSRRETERWAGIIKSSGAKID